MRLGQEIVVVYSFESCLIEHNLIQRRMTHLSYHLCVWLLYQHLDQIFNILMVFSHISYLCCSGNNFSTVTIGLPNSKESTLILTKIISITGYQKTAVGSRLQKPRSPSSPPRGLDQGRRRPPPHPNRTACRSVQRGGAGPQVHGPGHLPLPHDVRWTH